MTQQQWGQQPGQRPAGQPVWGQQPQWGQQQPPGWGYPAAPQRPAQGYSGYGAPSPYQGGLSNPAPQPPRSGSPLRLMLLGLVAAIAVGFFFVSLMNYLNADDEVTGPPAIGQTSAPPTGVPEPDFNPPDIPVPTTYGEAEQWLVDNAVYAESVQAPTNCTLGRLDATTAGVQALQDHLTNLTGCLMMVWQDPLARAGFEMPRPPITVYSQPITTACGESETHNAFYCAADQRIYYATDLPEVLALGDPDAVDNAFMVDNVIGHEFGHAIQGRTGMLVSYIAFRQQAETDEQANELGRRSEVQADCLSGMFLNAVAEASQLTDAERVGLADVSEAIGDDRLAGDPNHVGDHGTGEARRAWFETGINTTSIAACNTWTAPPEQVR